MSPSTAFNGPEHGPGVSVEQILSTIDAELSPRHRVLVAAMLVIAAAVTTTVAALLLTEAALPVRTQIGFGLIVLAGSGWCVYFSTMLLRRRTPYARHRIAAATMAVTACAVFMGAALALAWLEPTRATTGLWVATLMLPLLALASWQRWRASRELRSLIARRDALAARVGSVRG